MSKEKSFDEKMRELDKQIDRDLKAINLSLVGLLLQNLQNFRYTDSSGTPS